MRRIISIKRIYFLEDKSPEPEAARETKKKKMEVVWRLCRTAPLRVAPVEKECHCKEQG